MCDATDNGWSSCRLDKLIDFNPKERLPKGIDAPYVEMAALPQNGRWHDEPVLRAVNSGARFRDDDTLLARITPCLENGKTAQVRGLGPGVVGWGSTEFIVMRAKQGVADPNFVYLIARDPGFREYAIQQMTGTSGRQRVPTESIASFELALPPLDEQRRIAEVLGALDDRIEVLRRLQGLLQDKARALLALALVDGAVEVKLGDIADVVMGNSPPGSSYNTDGMGTPLFQGCAEFGFRYPLERLYTTQPSRMAAADDTLVSVRAPVGKLNRASGACCIGRGVAAVRSDAYPSLVYYALDASNDVWDPYNSEGTVFGSINGGSLRGLKVTWPANPDVFERELRGIDEAINRFALEAKELVSSRAALLPALVSGELRVATAKKMVETKS